MQARYERIAQLLSLSGYAFAASALQSRRTPSRPRFAFWPLPGDWAKAGAPRRAARIAAVMSCFIAHLQVGERTPGVIGPPYETDATYRVIRPDDGSWSRCRPGPPPAPGSFDSGQQCLCHSRRVATHTPMAASQCVHVLTTHWRNTGSADA